jgi:diguanylate cyclase
MRLTPRGGRPGGDALTSVTALTWTATALCAGLALIASLLVGDPRPDHDVLLLTLALLAVGARINACLHRRGRVEALRLAGTDDLTALANRRSLGGNLERAVRAGRPLVLMLLDLDGFKAINDAYGHGTGDQVLRVVAARLAEVLDARYPPARLGGDEFAALVPYEAPEALVELGHRVRAHLAQPLDSGPADLVLRASIGFAVLGPDDAAGNRVPAIEASATEAVVADLLAAADAAMYRAKAGAGVVVQALGQDAQTGAARP